MKIFIRVLMVGLLATFLFTACAKQPTQDMDNAKAAVEAVSKEGAIYAKEEFKKLDDDLKAALDEVNAQSKKSFKSYGKAKEMLAKVMADADALKPVIAQKKEEAKNNALTVQATAKAAVEEAKTLLAKAPKTKGIEAIRADLMALENSLAEAQKAIEVEDYLGATDKANATKDKAAAITDQIKKAMQKVTPKKK